MSAGEIAALTWAATGIAFVHTLSGPDHYLPLAALSHASAWPTRRTLRLTVVAGMSHLAGSLLIGLVGIALGIAVHKLQAFESSRGDLAALALVAFGVAYTVWGAVAPPGHAHRHDDGSLVVSTLVAIIALGACEPLIPILMVPVARQSLTGLVLILLAYAVSTLGAMVAGVVLAVRGTRLFPAPALARWSRALAGATMAACGLAIVVLGL